MSDIDYLNRIRDADVYAVAVETPLEIAPLLSKRIGNELLLKREDLQPIFSFKIRGALNKINRLPAEEIAEGCYLQFGGQSCPRRCPRRRSEGRAGRHCHAGNDAVDQS